MNEIQDNRTPNEVRRSDGLKKFMDSPIAFDDPYWSLFDFQKKLNEVIVEAVQYGFNKGYDQSVADQCMDTRKMIQLEPFISKIGGWANFKGFVEREIK